MNKEINTRRTKPKATSMGRMETQKDKSQRGTEKDRRYGSIKDA